MTLNTLSQVLGGIGLFLIGMVLATDGLREAAGDSLRSILLRFTVRPVQSMASGAGITALVQSSSVTTVATISFVAAGLLTFQQALGLILGANIGTTATGWIVALLGLKFSVSTFALPLVGVGALMRLFTRGRTQDIGLAIAGFGVLFVGLDVLQAGMATLSEVITPESLPRDTWAGRLGLVGIGFGLTSAMQSSSAAIAITLTALHSGNISMMQAAAMAIGANVGTTTTAGLAMLGAGTSAKRVAFAHLLFNVLTGVVAFAALPVLVEAAVQVDPGNATIALAAFHTIFNLVGVALVFPFLERFSGFVQRVIPEKGPRLTRRLDPSLADHGSLAVVATRRTVLDITRVAVDAAWDLIVLGDEAPDTVSISELRPAVEATHAFVESLRDLDGIDAVGQERHVDVIHALDYLDQLVHVLEEAPFQPSPHVGGDALKVRDLAIRALESVQRWLVDDPPVEHKAIRDEMKQIWQESAVARKEFRKQLLTDAALGKYNAGDANMDIEYARRLDELTFHLYRIVKRLSHSRTGTREDEDDDESKGPT